MMFSMKSDSEYKFDDTFSCFDIICTVHEYDRDGRRSRL